MLQIINFSLQKGFTDYTLPKHKKMNPTQIDSFNNFSIDQLLNRQLKSPTQTLWVIILAKARIQQSTQESIKMTLLLLLRDGNKWLEVLKRFSYLDFKLVFSLSIRHMRTYMALLESVHKLGESQHQRMLEQNIQKAMDGQRKDIKINKYELWDLYLCYLSQWARNLPHRTLYALEKIEKRLSGSGNNFFNIKDNNENSQEFIFYDKLTDKEKIPFIEALCSILKYHEQTYTKKLQLRKFYQSVPFTLMFLHEILYNNQLLYKAANTLDTFDNVPDYGKNKLNLQKQQMGIFHSKKRSFEETQQRDQQIAVLMIIKSSQLSYLQDLFIRCTRLTTLLVRIQTINYSQYNTQNSEELQRLQSSLIYHIKSDDLPSLISQLLVSLGQNVPNFLNLFVTECMFYLEKDNLDQVRVADIILKLCILSKQIVEEYESTDWEYSMKDLIDKLVVLSDSRSQTLQVKTLLMMHYFKEILPESYFMQYHTIIFRMLKSIINSSIENNRNAQKMEQNHNPLSIFKPFQYTRLSYSQCIKILQQETQPKQEQHKNMIEMKIRKKKFKNQKVVNDQFRTNVLDISDKLIDLITIEGYCEEQTKIVQIFRNLLIKFPEVIRRNTCHLVKILTRLFMNQFYRLRNVTDKKHRNFAKIFVLLQCLQLVWEQVDEEMYLECEQKMVEMFQLLNGGYVLEFEDQLVKILVIMIQKADMITPQLNSFIIYTRTIVKNTESHSILPISGVIRQLTRPNVVKSVRAQYLGLVELLTNMFNSYLEFTLTNETMQIYKKNWEESTHLIQLFVQSYAEEFDNHEELRWTLQKMHSILCSFLSSSQNEQINQILMTIHHILGFTQIKKKSNLPVNNMPQNQLYSQNDPIHGTLNQFNIQFLQLISNLDIYKEKYSLHLLQLTLLDTLNINLRKGIFDFSNQNNPIYNFLDSYKSLALNIEDTIRNKSNSNNDILPFNKINLIQYTIAIVDSLKKDKYIDIQQFTELKSILLPQNCLISHSLFR